MNEMLKNFPVIIKINVSWGEMDAFQHVNNIVYFRYFESARIAHFEKLEMMELMEKTGLGPILASTQCRFRIPLTYPDVIRVGSKISQIDKDRFTMEYCVVSEQHQKVAAQGEGVVVCYNYKENSKASLPEEVKQRILTLEKTVAET